jgi:DNA-binding IclR family transcriptional regulator
VWTARSSSRWRCGTSGALADEARKAGKVFAAMSISGPASRLNNGRLNELVPDSKRISAAFSEAFARSESPDRLIFHDTE